MTGDFFQIVGLLARRSPGSPAIGHDGPARDESVRFHGHPGLESPVSMVHHLAQDAGGLSQPHQTVVSSTFLNLVGASSPLPLHYTDAVLMEKSPGSMRLEDFYNLLHHRIHALLYRAWAKHRYTAHVTPARDDPFSEKLKSFTGMEFSPAGQFLRHAGLLIRKPISASALRTLLADGFSVPVRIAQCLQRTITVALSDQKPLGDRGARLGDDSLVGDRLIDRSTRLRVRVGPLNRSRLRHFLPGGSDYRRLTGLLQSVVPIHLECEIELLRDPGRNRWRLGGFGSALGWTTALSETNSAGHPVTLDPRTEYAL
jgi:type VI secretion system protein ImpH